VSGRDTLAFVNVDGLVGFEVGDLQSGLVLDRVVVDDSNAEDWGKYECPSHGIATTDDGRELWITDGVNNRLHIFDATMYPPALTQTLEVAGTPRWIAFSRDATYAYASNGDVMDRAARKKVARLEDEDGLLIQSESMIEVTK
jgi:DNA-binding beta-propeller fold protein YncE